MTRNTITWTGVTLNTVWSDAHGYRSTSQLDDLDKRKRLLKENKAITTYEGSMNEIVHRFLPLNYENIKWALDFFHPDSLQIRHTSNQIRNEASEDMRQFSNTNEDDMVDTIEIKLTEGMVNTITTSLKIHAKHALEINSINVKALKGTTKERFPDNHKIMREAWEARVEAAESEIKVCTALSGKLESGKRPLKLQKNERALLAKVVGDVTPDLTGMFAGDSSIKDVGNPDRFYGFPSLGRAMKSKITEANNVFKNLTRSDVNVSIK